MISFIDSSQIKSIQDKITKLIGYTKGMFTSRDRVKRNMKNPIISFVLENPTTPKYMPILLSLY